MALQKNGDPSPFTGNPADSLSIIVQDELAFAIEAHPMDGDTINHIGMVGASLQALVSDQLNEIGGISNNDACFISLLIYLEDISIEGDISSYLALVQLLETIIVEYPELDDDSRDRVLQAIALLKHVRFEYDRFVFDLIGTDRVSPLASCMDAYFNNCMDEWINSYTGPIGAVIDILIGGAAYIASTDCMIQAYIHCREQVSK